MSVDERGRSPLFNAVNRSVRESQLEYQLECVKKQLGDSRELGILTDLIDKADNNNQTPLFIASESGKLEYVTLLLENGAKTGMMAKWYDDGYRTNQGIIGRPEDPRWYDGITPLMIVILKGHLELVNVLLKYKVDVNLKDEDGKTALDFAAEEECAFSHYEIQKEYEMVVGSLVHAGAKFSGNCVFCMLLQIEECNSIRFDFNFSRLIVSRSR